MKITVFIVLFALYSFCSFAQKILRLDIQRPFKIKQINFYSKDNITLKLKSDRENHYGKIIAIGDSSFIIANKTGSDTVMLSEVRMIILNHSNYLTKSFSSVFTIAGSGVMAIDVVNNLFNNETQIVKRSIVKTGVGLIVTGIIIKLSAKRRHKISKRKKLKVIDLSPY